MRSVQLFLVLLAACAMLGAANAQVGKPESSAVDSDENAKAAAFALSKLNSGTVNQLGASGSMRLVRIKKVTTQVVAGIKYNMLLEVQDDADKTLEIVVSVWARPWLEKVNDAEEGPAWQLTEARLAH
jgi:hypothetical protein